MVYYPVGCYGLNSEPSHFYLTPFVSDTNPHYQVCHSAISTVAHSETAKIQVTQIHYYIILLHKNRHTEHTLKMQPTHQTFNVGETCTNL